MNAMHTSRFPALLLAATLAACLAWGCSSQAVRDYESAEKALQAGRQDQALELLERALASGLSEPLVARALHDKALIHLSREEYAQAEADAGQALEHSLRRAETYLLRGLSRLARHNPSQARDDFDAALVIDPDNPGSLVYRGQARLELGDAPGAVADLTSALESRRADAGLKTRALFLRANIHASQGRTDQAVTDLKQAARTSPDKGAATAALLRAALILEQTSDLAGAEAVYDEIVDKRPDLVDARRRRGNLRFREERYREAAQDYEQGLKLAPDDADLHNQLAWLLATAPEASLRDGKRAVALAQRAVDLTDTGNAMYIDTLAAALAEAGRMGQAVTAQETALLVLGQTGPAELEPEFRARLELFRQGRPYRSEP